MASRLPPNTMSLQRFMLRQQTLKLYRDILKVLRNIPNDKDRAEMMKWARDDFKKNKGEQDEEAIRMMYAYGQRQLKSIENMVPRKT